MDNSILTGTQIDFLREAGHFPLLTDNFYLTGGTALAGFYLFHRYSEDLDFFSEKEIDLLNLDIALKRIREKLNVDKIDFQQSYNRNLFFFHFGNDVLKTEFTFFPFAPIEKGVTTNGISVDSLLDIAVNKLFTIYQRTAARDYIDLYTICREKQFSVADLIKKARIKFDWHIDPLQLGTQFIKAADAKDYPRMIKEVPPQQWQAFFIEEAKKLKPEIIN